MTALIVGGALVAVGCWWVAAHNRLVQQRQHVTESWRDVDVELRRRHDLVPALVEVVRAYAAHEAALLTTLTRGAARVSGDVTLVGERCPGLSASTGFLRLQQELAETEDRLAAARRVHASNVERYNARVQSLPTSLVARAGGFEAAAYAEIAAS